MKLKKGARVKEINPTEELLNEDLISRAIWECLKDGDSDGVIEVIATYCIAKKASVARSLKKKDGNPTVKEIAKLVHACA